MAKVLVKNIDKMNRLKKVFGIGALVLTFLTTGGCKGGVLGGRPPPIMPSYVRGIVTKEQETLPQLVESSGSLFGNESIKISDPTYTIQVKTEDELYTTREGGLYTISVKESYRKPLEALALAIEEGSRIKVKEEYWDSHFGENKVGYLYSDEIIVCGKK